MNCNLLNNDDRGLIGSSRGDGCGAGMATGRSEPAPAGVVRAIAGAPAGWRARRRGSFLVLTVGILALLAVITIVYATIGIGDRQRAGAKTTADRIAGQVGGDGSPGQIADYIATIVGRDALDVTFDEGRIAAGQTRQRFTREAHDVPSSSYLARSTGQSGVDADKFNPTGGPNFAANGRALFTGPDTNPWLPTDPWLASSEPAYLDFELNGSPNHYLNTGASPAEDQSFRANRDWLHISNIAPNGAYVNLFNLRENFDSRQGTNAGQINSRLSLLAYSTGNVPNGVDFRVTPSATTDFGRPINLDRPAYFSARQRGMFTRLNAITGAGIGPNEVNYGDYQYADTDGDGFYDARWQELFDEADPENVWNLVPRDPKFRYFVATRIIDLSSMVNVNTATDLLASPFFGTDEVTPVGVSPAEVDLRRLLTMSDFAEQYPAPAGVNRRLYEGIPVAIAADPYRNWYNPNTAAAAGGYAYRALRLSLASGSIPGRESQATTTTYWGVSLTGRPPIAPTGQTLVNELGLGPVQAAANTIPVARAKWNFSAAAPDPLDFTGGARLRLHHYQSLATRFAGAGTPDALGSISASSAYGFDDLVELNTRRVYNDPASESPLEQTLAGRGGRYDDTGVLLNNSNQITAVFDDARRLSPLRSNRTLEEERLGLSVAPASNPLNAPSIYRLLGVDVRSRLTTVSGARPLRAARGVSPERLSDASEVSDPTVATSDVRIDAHRAVVNFLQPDFGVATTGNPPQVDLTLPRREAQFAKYDSLARIFRGYADALAPFTDDPAAWANTFDPSTLAGTLTVPVVPTHETQTLFYGHKGPELAVLTAARMAVNFKDMVDGDTRPTGVTVLLDGDPAVRDILNTEGLTNTNLSDLRNLQFPFWHPWRAPQDSGGQRSLPGFAFDLDFIRERNNQQLNPPTTGIVRRLEDNPPTTTRAINLFGLTPHPFVTGALTMTVYHDTSDESRARSLEISPGDFQITDFNQQTDADYNPVAGSGVDVTVRPAISYKNFDMLFRMFAVQVTNPTSVDIQLGNAGVRTNVNQVPQRFAGLPGLLPLDLSTADIGDPDSPELDRQEDFFYVRFGKRVFKLVDVVYGDPIPATPTDFPNELAADRIGIAARNVTLQAGETVIFYALNQPLPSVARRIKAISTSTGTQVSISTTDVNSLRDDIEDRLNEPGSGIDAVYLMLEINPNDGRPASLREGDPLETPNNTVRYESWLSGTGSSTVGGVLVDRRGLNAFGQLWVPTVTGGAPRKENLVVELWRSMRVGPEAIPEPLLGQDIEDYNAGALQSNQASNPWVMPPRNVYENDLLCDRLHVPSDANLDVRVPPANLLAPNTPIDLTGMDGGDGNNSSGFNDDYGLTFALWATVRRPADPNGLVTATTSQIPVGAWPAYCLDIKDSGSVATDSWNKYRAAQGQSTTASATWIMPTNTTFNEVGDRGAGYDVDDTLQQIFSVNPDLEDWRDAPWKRTDTTGLTIDGLPRSPEIQATASAGAIAYDRPAYIEMYPEAAFDPRLLSPMFSAATPQPPTVKRPPLRPVDMLRPMAVGAMHDPLAVPAGITIPEEQRLTTWTTVGEMLAATMGFETLPFPAASTDPGWTYPLFYAATPRDVGNGTAVRRTRPANTAPRPFDRGQLVLDDYVPFLDLAPTDGRFNPASDRRRGLQIPAALAILDQFNTLGRTTVLGDGQQYAPTGVALGGIDQSIPGVININTASQVVQRAIPMLSPIAGTDPTGEFRPPTQPLWWLDSDPANSAIRDAVQPTLAFSGASFSQPRTDFDSDKWDMTAGVTAYRDKIPAYLKPAVTSFYTSGIPPLNLQNQLAAFDDGNARGIGLYPDEANPQRFRGRGLAAQIPGLNEQPGFRSIGELLCVRQRNPEVAPGAPGPYTPEERTYSEPTNIDALGFDVDPTVPRTNNDWARNSGTRATDTILHKDSRGTTAADDVRANGIANDWSEQLAVAGGAWGSISTRSDLYACWFVVHGYQRSDVDAVRGTGKPLVPSIARRFFMVLDRSNVRSIADKARIVVFREVPID